MKSSSITIAIAVFLLLSGAAAAVEMTDFEDGCYCVELSGDYGISDTPETAQVQSLPETYHIEVDARVCKSGDEITVTVLDSNPGVTINNLEILSLYKEEINLTANGTCAMGHSFEGTMTLVGDGEHYQSSSASGTIDGLIDVSGYFEAEVSRCQEEIPEFPTIALPMVAVVGLALLMQRRKQ